MDRRLELLAEMTPAIWIHLIAAVIAVVLGAVVLFRRKGDAKHKLSGRIWVGLMVVVSVSSFFITEIRDGKFSPIHLLSLYTLGAMFYGVMVFRLKPRAEAISAHQKAMKTTYILGMLIAGAFSFLPHRLLGRLMTEATVIPHVVLLAASLVGVVMLMRNSRKLV